ncbi:MAG: hypothetical protein IT383_10080 [Deltaproteobacteria bacterium]|nr:hypothetical protein [Deltaproteobacteria bacterium]
MAFVVGAMAACTPRAVAPDAGGVVGEGEGEGEGEGDCTPACASRAVCVAGSCREISSLQAFSVAQVALDACVSAEHLEVTGDDRGGLATTRDAVFLAGDSNTGRFLLADPADGAAIGAPLDGLVSDLRTGAVYTFAHDGVPFLAFVSDTISELVPLDPESGAVAGPPLALSPPLGPLSRAAAPGGVFAGLGRAAVLTQLWGPERALYIIDLESGVVTERPAPTIGGATACESWAVWGLLETIEGEDWLVSARPDGLVRTRVSDSRTELVQRFEDLGDTCAFSVSLFAQRWAFHHEGASALSAHQESVGSCPTSFCFDDVCVCPATAPTDCGGRCADLTSSPSHCGACGETCAANASCVLGECSCDDGAAVVCADVDAAAHPVCTRTDIDPLHCGDCDTRCGRNVPCVSGRCVPPVHTCGDGALEDGEDCDDGNTVDGDSCPADCLATPCGPVAVCFDGDPCTRDICVDAATGLCSFAPAAEHAACDRDGRDDTADTCRAGLCTPPAPDPALLLLEPEILADPAFSFRAIHDRLAADGDGPALFAQWTSTMAVPVTVNGYTIEARPALLAYLASVPRDGDGAIDLDLAGFHPAAFVHRIDLMGVGHCGETRVVYTKDSGLWDRDDRMSIIFEMSVPDDGNGCVDAARRWTDLRALSGDALREAAAQLWLERSQPSRLAALRTNEMVHGPFWELREFHLEAGVLVPSAVKNAPAFSLQTEDSFRDYVRDNAAAFNAGAHGSATFPPAWLAPNSRADGSRLVIGDLVPSMPGLEANLNAITCAGCHLTETGTSFLHVEEATPARPALLSAFLRGELEYRGVLLDALTGP